MSVSNPFFEISLLPYQAPHFDEINDSHYRPAFDEAIRQKRADIAAIVAQTAAPDFNNTVLALEKSDFKGQSGADKVVTLYKAVCDYKPKFAVVSVDEAAAASNGAKREMWGAV